MAKGGLVMKGYCVDVRGFNLDKKGLVFDAISNIIGDHSGEVEVSSKVKRVGNVFECGEILDRVVLGPCEMSDNQLPYKISFNDLMLEAGFNYEEHGVEDFKCIDWSEREVTESKSTSSKTRPQITREQYDAVMAQSDKRTFTKALDDLLAIETEQLLDESAIRINRLEGEVEKLNSFIELKDEQLDCLLNTAKRLEGENERFREVSLASKVEKYASTGDVNGVDNTDRTDAHYDLCGRRCERIIYSIVSLVLLAALVASLFFK